MPSILSATLFSSIMRLTEQESRRPKAHYYKVLLYHTLNGSCTLFHLNELQLHNKAKSVHSFLTLSLDGLFLADDIMGSLYSKVQVNNTVIVSSKKWRMLNPRIHRNSSYLSAILCSHLLIKSMDSDAKCKQTKCNASSVNASGEGSIKLFFCALYRTRLMSPY